MSHLVFKKVDGKNKLFNKITKKNEGDLPADDESAKEEVKKTDKEEDKKMESPHEIVIRIITDKIK
jgi:hypothetical protein